MALTKHDIVARLQAELGFTKSQSIQVTECLLDQIKASLESGEDVLVLGFGKFLQFRKKANFCVALHLDVAAAYISTPHSSRFARLELELSTKLSGF
jgi:hypothetical protein